jgi:hypothetical protein
MKKGNIVSIDHNGQFELCEIVGFAGERVTLKILNTGEILHVYREEFIPIVDGF